MRNYQTIIDTDEWEVMTDTGWQDFSGVVITHDKETIEIDGLVCTPSHKVQINSEWILAETLPHTKKDIMDVYDLINVANGNSYITNNYISHNCLVLDEFAFLETNMAEDFFMSVFPTVSSGKDTKILITSTPRGLNHYWKFWNEAEKGLNGFIPYRVRWDEHPDRDIDWYNEQKQVLGELKVAQEIECNFIGSSLTLLSGATLSRLSADIPIKVYSDDYKGLRIYKHPIKDHSYTMTCDVSRGRHLDDSAFTVYDITSQPFTVAAVYNNNEVAPLMYSNIIHKIAKNYNDAYVLVEINDAGGEVTTSLYWDFEYENMYWTKSGAVLGKKGADPYPGIRTTKKTKIIGCANVKDLIDRNNLIINDQETITQFGTFVQNNTGSYAGDDTRDDLVMTHVLFGWLANQPWFKDLTNQDMRNEMYADSISRIEEDLMLPIFFDNGLGSEEIDYGLAGEFR